MYPLRGAVPTLLSPSGSAPCGVGVAPDDAEGGAEDEAVVADPEPHAGISSSATTTLQTRTPRCDSGAERNTPQG